MDLDRSILVWLIVTNLTIQLYRDDKKVNRRLPEVTNVLSNYMMFLLVVKPNMLPRLTRRIHDVPFGGKTQHAASSYTPQFIPRCLQ